jgi:hypothetical protein
MASLRSNGSFSSSLKRDGEVIPDCRCGFKAVICTVMKKGPNKGRKFWGCRGWNVSHKLSFFFLKYSLMMLLVAKVIFLS